jgi:predicted nucleotidyltransferase
MNIIDFLKKNENARKVFGKRELKIIEKQLLGINLTQSEKNRLSRDIRRKLEFIKEISNFKEVFHLKKGLIVKELINEGVSEIMKNELSSKIKEIILFGSTVENKRTFRSDIDLAVKFDNLIDSKEAVKFRMNVKKTLPESIDIQVLEELPLNIRKDIELKGRVIWKRE